MGATQAKSKTSFTYTVPETNEVHTLSNNQGYMDKIKEGMTLSDKDQQQVNKYRKDNKYEVKGEE